MGYLLLALSALALAAAGYLWRADAQEKNAASVTGDNASVSGEPQRSELETFAEVEPRQEKAPQPEREALQQTEPEKQPGRTVEAVPETVGAAENAEETAETAETTDAAETLDDEEAAAAAETETTAGLREAEEAEELVQHDPKRDVLDQQDMQHDPKRERKRDELDHHEQQHDQKNDPQHDQKIASRPKEKTHSRWGTLSGAISGALPGAKQRGRKERREWAEANGFEYSREDEFLQDEWGRGAASIGAPVRDVLTGTRFGHETRIADIGETTVVAMGTGMDSGVVVDMRRKANAEGATEDLVAVAELEGFRVFASEAGPAERMLDIRVTTALELLPPQVSAVWFETEWVLAELDGTPGAQEWEPVFAPLALLADAARTLPPRTWPHLHFDTKTREMGDPVEAPTSAKGDDVEHVRPVVARPEEPLELPTRITGAVRGTMEYRTVGGDEVDAIATGEPPEQLNDGTRLTRRPQPPSIFGDDNAD